MKSIVALLVAFQMVIMLFVYFCPGPKVTSLTLTNACAQEAKRVQICDGLLHLYTNMQSAPQNDTELCHDFMRAVLSTTKQTSKDKHCTRNNLIKNLNSNITLYFVDRETQEECFDNLKHVHQFCLDKSQRSHYSIDFVEAFFVSIVCVLAWGVSFFFVVGDQQ